MAEETFMARFMADPTIDSEFELANAINRWHEGTGEHDLYEHLGMTREEYGEWLSSSDFRGEIGRIRDRRLAAQS